MRCKDREVVARLPERQGEPRVKRLLIALLAALALPAFAQSDYPSKPIRMIVGYAPGGGTDIMARIVATRMSEHLGQSVVVENRPGNSGIVGAAAVAKAPPDGYTLMMGVMSLNTIQPHLVQLPYDPIKDLTPINLVASVPHFILVPPSLGVDTLAELIAYCKKNPGKISYPSAGTGTSTHLGGEMFRKQAGDLDMVHVPYKSAGHSMPDLLAGRLQVAFETLPTTSAYVKQGKLKALATTSPKRLAQFPDVPTMHEVGMPNYRLRTWYGLFGPGGLPAPIVKKLHAEVALAVQSGESKTKLVEMGMDDTVTTTPEDFAAMVRSELDYFGKLVKEAGIKLTE
jgi:tripartite-type tricarboxylate transporter receptor subunit TctC